MTFHYTGWLMTGSFRLWVRRSLNMGRFFFIQNSRISTKFLLFVRSSTCKFQQSHSDSAKHPLIAIGSKHLQARLPWCSVHHPKDAKVLKWKKTNTLLVARAWPPYITGSDWWPPVSPLSFCKLLLIVVSTRHTS